MLSADLSNSSESESTEPVATKRKVSLLSSRAIKKRNNSWRRRKYVILMAILVIVFNQLTVLHYWLSGMCILLLVCLYSVEKTQSIKVTQFYESVKFNMFGYSWSLANECYVNLLIQYNTYFPYITGISNIVNHIRSLLNTVEFRQRRRRFVDDGCQLPKSSE